MNRHRYSSTWIIRRMLYGAFLAIGVIALTPDERTYQPKLSSVEVRPPRRAIQIGKYRFPLGKADVRLLRKSKPFWSLLSDFGIFNCILRVPITFPAEKLRGVQLSAMCTPDIRGTQGTFSLFTTRTKGTGEKTGGEVQLVTRKGAVICSELLGLAEDTWGLNEHVLSDEHFLRQCLDFDCEREQMFFDALANVPRGLCVCVFDGSDRMQHMFWRYHDVEHPARPPQASAECADPI